MACELPEGPTDHTATEERAEAVAPRRRTWGVSPRTDTLAEAEGGVRAQRTRGADSH